VLFQCRALRGIYTTQPKVVYVCFMNTQANRPEPPITLGPDEARNLPTWRAAFSERTAELMAKLALLAYESDPKKLSQLLNAGQFTLLAAYDQDGSQAFLARANDFAVVAFRGTDSYRDWKTNLMSETVLVETRLGDVEIHKGFKKAYDRIGAQLLEDVNRLVPDTKGLYLTGHSLGGAMAQIASTQLERDNLAACYTFGAPRVGDLSFDRLVVCPHYRLSTVGT
jgi:triacylglycerol lipase